VSGINMSHLYEGKCLGVEMKWQGRRGSRNIEDRRRRPRRKAAGAGGIGGIGLIAMVVIGYFLGVDVTPFLNGAATDAISTQGSTQITEADERAADFVSVTLADTEEVWADIFQRQVGTVYNAPTLVLFKGQTQSACGGATAATGPFYCPSEQKAFLDTDFFVTMEQRLGAGGDFAAAYVVAHEIAHHVQNELDILPQVNRMRAQADEETSNALSVRVELQADCFAGIWASAVQDRFGTLERGDIAEAMNAAAQIGDDTLARNAGRAVQPHTFTHGTSAQRQRWFQRGYDSGDLTICDTFSVDQL
jgi:predicted metalloprotease